LRSIQVGADVSIARHLLVEVLEEGGASGVERGLLEVRLGNEAGIRALSRARLRADATTALITTTAKDALLMELPLGRG